MSKFIKIVGAREHNLRNVSLEIPREKFIVFTGLSGSGKSSLAFDTIYAEGQRRYVESLSAYARQFLGQLEKPDVDSIEGLSPAISIEQKTTHRNPRSTVGTVTEIYDYMRLIFARLGEAYCPVSGRKLEAQPLDTMVERILSLTQRLENEKSLRLIILAPIVHAKKGEFKDLFSKLQKEGFARVRVDSNIINLDEEISLKKNNKHNIEIVVDRLVLRKGEEQALRSRLSESVELALSKGEKRVIIHYEGAEEKGEEQYSSRLYSPFLEEDFPPINHRLFSFNSPDGACANCSGLGEMLTFHEDLLIRDWDKPVIEGLGSGLGFSDNSIWYTDQITFLADRIGFSVNDPWKKISKKAKKIIFYGEEEKSKSGKKIRQRGFSRRYTQDFEGIIPNLRRRYESTASDFMRSRMEQYMIKASCPICHGSRLNQWAMNVKFRNKNIHDVTCLSIEEAHNFFQTLRLDKTETIIASQALKEILSRLEFLKNVGVGYLTLNRTAGSLSGGEAQRIRLATQIGSALMGVLYVLDEPSIGLHQSDNERLIKTLSGLRDLGNTVLVVEHDEDTIASADYIVDIGPGAGRHGGEIVFAGTYRDLLKSKASITGLYLSGKKKIDVPVKRRTGNNNEIKIIGAAANNLKNIDVVFPLGKFICVTGLSGSGKSTLINDILYRALASYLYPTHVLPGKHKSVIGLGNIDKVIDIDQSPIGRTPRSNPATYTGTFGPIRDLFSQLPESNLRGYKPGRFSFNVVGGRCEACEGDGVKKIEMHFLSDVYVTCEVCNGKRYNRETLEIKYKGKNIFDVLEMSCEEALDFFDAIYSIKNKLQALCDVGLGYIKLGQQATTLSGGEAQRIKLASELSKRSTGKTMYILDEPTTGLHFEDIRMLLNILHRFVDEGNTVVVIEHNMDVIKTCDHIIDLGPWGGANGGEVIAQGTPEQIIKNKSSITGKFLAKWLSATSK